MTKLGRQHLAVIGAGGLGVSVCWGLLAGWPETLPLSLTIIDRDNIELSNLNRQVFFTENDLERPKAETLRQRLLCGLVNINCQDLNITAVQAEVSLGNIDSLLSSASLVIDACDNAETKFLLNDYCVSRAIPFCYGGVVAGMGQLMLIPSRKAEEQEKGGCLRCLFGDFQAEDYKRQTASCQQNGIVGAIAGHIGFMQSEAVLKYITCSILNAPQTGSGAKKSELIRISMPSLIPTASIVPAAKDCPLGCGRQDLRQLDLRGKLCPTPFLFAKLALEQLETGQALDLRFGTETSWESVSASLSEEQHSIFAARRLHQSEWILLVEKK